MNTQRRSEGGQALVLLVLALVGLLGFTALAIDGGMVYSDRRNAQNAADTAALAGALAKVEGQNWYQKALDRAASNHYVKGGTATDVQVYDPPINGPYAGKDEYIQVIITSTVNTSFAQFVFGGPLRNTVESVAHAKPGTVGPPYDGHAIVGLAQTACSVVFVHGNQSTDITGSGILVNSSNDDCATDTNECCAFTVSGGAGHLSAPSIDVVGGAKLNTGDPSTVLGSTPLNTGYQPQYPYPPNFNVPTPDCTTNAKVTGNTMDAGNYSGTFPPARVTKLNPGVYCINGDFVTNGGDTLEGSDIFLYIKGKIKLDGNSTVDLSAKMDDPDGTYPYKGLLMYVDPQNYANVPNCTVILNGTSDTKLVGTVMAPSCDVSLLGTNGTDSYHSQVIGYTVEMGGTLDLYLTYNPLENYVANDPALISTTQ
jgi:Flp pilus assembly protein TadG